MTNPLRRFGFSAALCATLALVALAQDPNAPLQGARSPQVGQPAIPIIAHALDGREFRLPESYKGKIVLVNFWATWCSVSEKQLHILKPVYNKFHPEGFEVLGVLQDDVRGVKEDASREFMQKEQIGWENIYDAGHVLGDTYGIESTPTGFLVDGDTGQVIATGQEARGLAMIKVIEREVNRKKAATQPASQPTTTQASQPTSKPASRPAKAAPVAKPVPAATPRTPVSQPAHP